MKAILLLIWDAIKRFFRWPYSVYTLLLILGVIEYLANLHLCGTLTIGLGAWAFIIEFTRPKVRTSAAVMGVLATHSNIFYENS